VVVVEGKKPGEREDVFIHPSYPVSSIMSRDWPLSIQPAEQVSRSCDGRRGILFFTTLNFHIKMYHGGFGRSRGRERKIMFTCMVLEKAEAERTHDDCGFHVLKERRPAHTSLLHSRFWKTS